MFNTFYGKELKVAGVKTRLPMQEMVDPWLRRSLRDKMGNLPSVVYGLRPHDRGAWGAAVHGVKELGRLSINITREA